MDFGGARSTSGFGEIVHAPVTAIDRRCGAAPGLARSAENVAKRAAHPLDPPLNSVVVRDPFRSAARRPAGSVAGLITDGTDRKDLARHRSTRGSFGVHSGE